jgi:hypothetical protein
VGVVHRAQVGVGVREHNLGPPAREQDDIMSPFLVQSKSFIVIVRATLVRSSPEGQYRALVVLDYGFLDTLGE